MPTKRTKRTRHQRIRVTDAAREAFRAGEWMTLHRALGLKPWEVSPLDADDGPCPYPLNTGGGSSWEQAKALRAELEETSHADEAH
jgi:hypothetical protein